MTALGLSAEHRPLELHRFGSAPAPRVLILGGQHGDETLATEAVRALANRAPGDPALAGLEIALVPCVNPDGRCRGIRAAATGHDLNRDHLLLDARETEAVHAFARAFAPELVIDVHTFRGRRRALRQRGFQHGADVLFGWSNFSFEAAAAGAALARETGRQLSGEGLRAGQYFVTDAQGRLRTSSVDLVDARNGLASSVGALGLLVEGREPTRQLGDAERTRWALVRAVANALTVWRGQRRASHRTAAVLTDVRRGPPRELSAWLLRRGANHPRREALSVRGEARERSAVERPLGYLLPIESPAAVVLRRQGYAPSAPPAGTTARGWIQRARRSARPGAPWRRLRLDWTLEGLPSHSYQFWSAEGPRGLHLARLLEPASRYGLHRYPSLELAAAEGESHPILRVVKKGDPLRSVAALARNP